MKNLSKRVSLIKNVGLKKTIHLGDNNIYNFYDLIKKFPKQYKIIKKSSVEEVLDTNSMLIQGTINSIIIVKKYKSNTKAITFDLLSDDKLVKILVLDSLKLRFRLNTNENVSVYGTYDKAKNEFLAKKVFFELVDEYIVPIYDVKQIPNNLYSNYVKNSFFLLEDLSDDLPYRFIIKHGLLNKYEYYKFIHEPKTINDLKRISIRYKYEYYYNLFKSKPLDLLLDPKRVVKYVKAKEHILDAFISFEEELRLYELAYIDFVEQTKDLVNDGDV